MPYIAQDRRKVLLVGEVPSTAGELNFMFTRLCKIYLDKKNRSYQHFNDCIGALQAAQLELYRRQVVGYEDEKIKSNGDVW